VITGGSRGLGLVLARKFAREGARVALLARNKEELRRAEMDLSGRGAEVYGVPCDVRKKEHVDQAVAMIVQRFGSVDVLINNAGIIQVGPFEHMTQGDFEDALAIHLFGPLFTTMAVLPHMRRKQAGRIVNISSIGGKIAVPHLLPYTVSKFALVGLSDGLRSELRKDNIFVTTVCPGLMRTGSPGNALFKGKHREEHAWFAIADSLPVISMDVRRAARRIIRACRYGSARLILGTHTKAAVLLNEIFPEAAANLLAMANRWLPETDQRSGFESHKGWESESKWAPSTWTSLSQKAAAENNEAAEMTKY
jgi:NAD(P)-dependent dehydrogenase (short-subunit alcohol dehydrogenase family)